MSRIYNTEELLEKVSLKLHTEFPTADISAANSARIVDRVCDHLKKLQPPPNDLASLFGYVHFILDTYKCGPKNPPNPMLWPCPMDYRSDVQMYIYYSEDSKEEFELTVLDELNPGGKQFFYIVTSLPANPHAYKIDRIDKELVFGSSEFLSELMHLLNRTFVEFVSVYASKPNKYRIRDPCDVAVKPGGKKRKRESNSPVADQPSGSGEGHYPDEGGGHLNYILKHYTGCENSTDGSRLLGCIFLTLSFLHGCTWYPPEKLVEDGAENTRRSNSWPCDIVYRSQAVQLWSPGAHFDVENAERKYDIFLISLLESSKEFFLNVTTMDREKFVFQKIIKELVPSFKANDRKSDKRKLVKLAFMCNHIDKKFIYKRKTFSLPTTGTGSAVTSTDASGSTSPSEEVAELSGTETGTN